MKEDLKNRNDVHQLVSTFYEKVKINPEIGYFFNNTIKDWDEHINKLTDFWEGSLFFSGTYSGNPQKAHIAVDAAHNHQISEKHFGVWLNLWLETINELFEGEIAERAKHNARKMATHLQIKIFQARY